MVIEMMRELINKITSLFSQNNAETADENKPQKLERAVVSAFPGKKAEFSDNSRREKLRLTQDGLITFEKVQLPETPTDTDREPIIPLLTEEYKKPAPKPAKAQTDTTGHFGLNAFLTNEEVNEICISLGAQKAPIKTEPKVEIKTEKEVQPPQNLHDTTVNLARKHIGALGQSNARLLVAFSQKLTEEPEAANTEKAYKAKGELAKRFSGNATALSILEGILPGSNAPEQTPAKETAQILELGAA